MTGKAQVYEPLAVEAAGGVFEQGNAPLVGGDQVVVGLCDFGDGPLNGQRGKWNLERLEDAEIYMWNTRRDRSVQDLLNCRWQAEVLIYETSIYATRVDSQLHLTLGHNIALVLRILWNQPNLSERAALRKQQITTKGQVRSQLVSLLRSYKYKPSFVKAARTTEILTTDYGNAFINVMLGCEVRTEWPTNARIGNTGLDAIQTDNRPTHPSNSSKLPAIRPASSTALSFSSASSAWMPRRVSAKSSSSSSAAAATPT